MGTTEHTKYLVIGAGVSGLSFAGRVDSADVLVLDGDSAIGGYCKTIKKDGFVWDYSGHFFHFKRPEIERYLIDRMPGQNIRVVHKDSRIFHRDPDGQGRLVDFPFQKNIHQLCKAELLTCLYDLWHKPERLPTSFEDMLTVKFGQAIADKFLIPYNEKLYATDLGTLDVEAMGRFFPYADLDQIIGNFKQADNASYNATFTYPEGGAIEYVKALASGVDPDRIRFGARVTRIDLAERVAHTADGRSFGYEYLISSAPFSQLLSMASVVHEPSIYSWNKVLIFNLGFDKKGPEDVHWMYFAGRDVVFYRTGFYDNIFDTDRMSMYVEIGFPADGVVTDAVVAEMKARVLVDLERCGLVDGHRLVAEHSIVLDPAYVHITKDSQRDVGEKKAILGLRGVHSIGRYGSWTYCSIEDNIVEAWALADRFNAVG
ncbi:MAG: protoporphyrinogen oxidase [Myxococcota bacterium]|jgi:protoporphyrinogen oxidase